MGNVTGARVLLTCASVIVIMFGLREAKTLVVPFLLATFIAILCAPFVAWLQRKRVPTPIAVLLVVIAFLGLATAIATVVGGSLTGFSDALPKYQDRVDGIGEALVGWLEELGVQADELGEQIRTIVRPGSILELLRRGLSGFLSAFSNTLLVVLTVIFMLFEAAGMPAKARAALGRPDADLTRFANAAREVQKYLAIKTAISMVTGLVIGIWVAIVGLDFALAWAFLAFLLNYIPTIGSIIAAVPAVLLAIVQLGVGKAALVALGFIVVNIVFGNFVEPQLLGRTLGMSTLVVFLSLVFWGWVLGPVGMLLSVPLTMVVKIALENSQDMKWLAVLLDSAGAVAARSRESDAKSGAHLVAKAE
ncbi:MAG: AI-2E family transporter [bacterium]|nr:AI-2E family transporter [bacterium]